MANANIPVTPGVGANLQTYENVIGGTPVQSEAVTLTNSAGVEEGTIANPVVVSGAFNLTPTASGGCLTSVQQALTTSASVKGSAGQVYGFDYGNPNSGSCWIFLYDTTSAPTIGSTTNLVYEKFIPAGAGSNVSFPQGIAFSAGIYIAVSTSATSSAAPSIGLTLTTLYI